jgi:hypothetical protein
VRIFPTALLFLSNVQIEDFLNIIRSNRNIGFSSFCEQNADQFVTSQSERIDEIVVTSVVLRCTVHKKNHQFAMKKCFKRRKKSLLHRHEIGTVRVFG